MVEIPTVEQLGARPLPTRQPGVQPAPPIIGQTTAATGVALARLGEAVAGFGEIEKEKADKRRTYNNQTSWLNFNTQADAALSQSMQTEFDADTGAFDFVERTMTAFDQSAQPFFQNLGPDATAEEVQRWQAAFNAKRFEVFNQAKTFQEEEQKRYYVNDLQTQLDTTLNEINKDPDSFSKWNKLFIDSLDASGLSARDKNTLRRKVSKEIVTATVNGFIAQKRFTEANDILEAYADASDQDGRAASHQNPIVNRILEIGETGERIKTTPNEGGKGNVSDTRWLQLLEQYRPDIIQAYGDDEQGLLDLRSEPSLVLELLADETEYNSTELDKLDIDPNPANLYLASVFGLSPDGGIVSILEADEETELSAVIPNEIYAQNRKLFEGKTVGWLKKYAENKMVAESSPANKVTNEDRLFAGPAFVNELRGKISTAQDNYKKALGTKRKGDYEYAMALDPFSVSIADISNDPSLISDQKATLINSLKSKQEKANKLRSVLAKIEFAPKALDPAKKEDRDGVNTYFGQQIQEVRGIFESLNEEFTEEDVVRVAVDVTKRTGIAPTSLVSQIAAGRRSLSPQEFTAAAEMASQLFQASGTAFMGQGGDKELMDLATDWRLAREHFNMTPDRATEFIMPVYDPSRAQTEKVLRETAQLELKGLTWSNVASNFDKYALGNRKWFFEGLTVGNGTDGDENLAVDDWKRLYVRNFINANGNEEIANARTAADFRRIYGPTELGPPGGEIVRNPIESQYPQLDPKIIKADMIADARAVLGDNAPDPENLYVVQTDVTREDIRAGREPRYALMYRVKDEQTDQWDMKIVPGGALYAPPRKDSLEYEQAAEAEFREAAARDERYVSGAWEDENVMYDRWRNSLVRRNEDGTITPFRSIYGIEYPEMQSGYPVTGTTFNAPMPEQEQSSQVGARVPVDDVVGLFNQRRPIVPGQPVEVRIPRPRAKPGTQQTDLLEQAVAGFEDYNNLATTFEQRLGAAEIAQAAQTGQVLETVADIRKGQLEQLTEAEIDALPRVDLAYLFEDGGSIAEQVRQSPGRKVSEFTGAGLSGRIISAESGGRATVKNPRSSAYGAGQFINSTWLSMIKKYRPGLAEGRTNAEILALRSDPILSAQMVDRYAEENTRVLVKAGLQATPGNVYMLHFLGPTQGKRVLKAKDTTPLSRLLSKSVLEANPNIKGQTAGWLKQWAVRKMS